MPCCASPRALAPPTTRAGPDRLQAQRAAEETRVCQEALARAQALADAAAREWIDVERELAPLARAHLDQTNLTHTAWSCRQLVESLAPPSG